MTFDIKDKVALISGGASGIGLEYAKELLRNGLRGVTLADINETFGEQALQEIQNEFGSNKAIFVRCDVTNKESYEEAFKKTIQTYKNLDILINNAGIANDILWEQTIAINFNGVVIGTLLGFEEYIPKYKTGDEGIILNTSSIAGIQPFSSLPIYTATKHAIVALSKSFGHKSHYKRTKVKVIAICPGVTDTPILNEISKKTVGPDYDKLLQETLKQISHQKPESVAKNAIKIIKEGKSGSVWVAEGGQEAFEYIPILREHHTPKP